MGRNSGKSWPTSSLNHAQIIALCHAIREEQNLDALVQGGYRRRTRLIQLIGGCRRLAVRRRPPQHPSLCQCPVQHPAREGVFADQYSIKKADFAGYWPKPTREVAARHHAMIESLEERVSLASSTNRS